MLAAIIIKTAELAMDLLVTGTELGFVVEGLKGCWKTHTDAHTNRTNKQTVAKETKKEKKPAPFSHTSSTY